MKKLELKMNIRKTILRLKGCDVQKNVNVWILYKFSEEIY